VRLGPGGRALCLAGRHLNRRRRGARHRRGAQERVARRLPPLRALPALGAPDALTALQPPLWPDPGGRRRVAEAHYPRPRAERAVGPDSGGDWLAPIAVRVRHVLEPAQRVIWNPVTPLILSTDPLCISCYDFFTIEHMLLLLMMMYIRFC
jgi:hypothetical protein